VTGRTGIGIIGCGNVFQRYVRGLARFGDLPVLRCADRDVGRAERAAKECGVSAYGTVADLLADPAVEIAVNLTPPLAHAEVSVLALLTGKHVYVEKPRPAGRSASPARPPGR
jgi:predicted dehydrogenase